MTSSGDLNNKRYLKAITKDITNFKDLQYYGTLYIGSKKHKMTFIYDTGSAWVWLPTSLCKTCPTNNLYDINKVLNVPDKKSNDEIIADNQVEILVYGTGEVGGIRISEDVYLHKRSKEVVKDFVMLGIVIANGIDGDVADGILGLGPAKPEEGRGNFVSALKNSSLIDNEIFSFDFNLEGERSKMIFGEIDRRIVRDPKNMVWIPMKEEEDYWSLPLKKCKYGNVKTMK